MASKKVYKVSFRGVILSGFDKDQVIENVHNISRIPKHTISRKFFSGKTVVIRRADSHEYASRLQKIFAQAGIETYINEFTETVSEDELLDSDSAEIGDIEAESSAEYDAPEKSPLTKKILAVVIVILLSVTTLYFFNNNAEQQDKDSTKHSIPSFLIEEQVKSLIKITDKSELNRLSQFTALLEIKANYLDIIKQEINSKDTVLSISTQNPLYAFKVREQTGILLSTTSKLPQKLIRQFQKELDSIKNDYSLKNKSLKHSCVKTPDIKVISTNNHLLLTTIEDAQKLKNFIKLSKQKQLNSNLLQLDKLFHQKKDSKDASFSFFYLNQHVQEQFARTNTKGSNYLALSSNNDSFWLSLDQTFFTKSFELLKLLNINTNNAIKLSSIKTKNLFELIRLIIAQSYPDNLFISAQSDPIPEQKKFEQEQIVKIKKTYSASDIKPYQNELDIELSAQWQSGPFALTTNQFKFNKNLVIELLAKGQNIHNLMEYSHSALLRIHSVLNKNNENILKQDCSDAAHSESYFRDLDGEQEAYINDDFLTYRTITAKKEINIKPGYNNNDINKIEGEIILQLPEKIQKKTIKAQRNVHYSQFENFSLLLRQHPETNSLEYGIIGKANHFITLRAYNYAGDIIDTLSLKSRSLIDKQIKIVQQKFSESIETIKVFYTKENKVISYPFAFKPELLSGSIPLSNPIGTYTATQLTSYESHPISFSHGKLDLKPLKNEVQLDNPAWLGQKWPGEKTSRNAAYPFYVNLFIHETNKDSSSETNKLDAVLNIKSNLSPFISQNITALRLTLLEDKSAEKNTLLDNFISFNVNNFLEGEPDIGKDGKVKPPEITPYLNSNSAFEISKELLSKDKNNRLHGRITLSLPTAFKTHSTQYVSLGQIIKLDEILIKSVQLNRHQIQFEITGKIKNLAQLKLYNIKNDLISELFEFKHIKKNKALLTLLYNDKIDTIKLVLSQNSTIKEYPFSFSR